jgi:L-rhamnose isomerase
VRPADGPWSWLHPDDAAVVAALRAAWCVVAATGVPAGVSFMDEIRAYERTVLAKRA